MSITGGYNDTRFLQYDFLRNSLYAGILIGLVAPLIGVFVVIRRLSLIADALSHVTLSGIASLLLEKPFYRWVLNPLYMGMIFSIGGALLIEKLRTVYKHYQELAIPIILSAGMGLELFSFHLQMDLTQTYLVIYLVVSVL